GRELAEAGDVEAERRVAELGEELGAGDAAAAVLAAAESMQDHERGPSLARLARVGPVQDARELQAAGYERHALFHVFLLAARLRHIFIRRASSRSRDFVGRSWAFCITSPRVYSRTIMANPVTVEKFAVGQSVRPGEDPRLLQGFGRYVDDVSLPHQAYAFVVRSPHAHAAIRSIETSAARAARGVLAVLTGADLAKDALGNLPTDKSRKRRDGSPAFATPRPALRRDRAGGRGRPWCATAAATAAPPWRWSWRRRSSRRSTRPSWSRSTTSPCRPSPRPPTRCAPARRRYGPRRPTTSRSSGKRARRT